MNSKTEISQYQGFPACFRFDMIGVLIPNFLVAMEIAEFNKSYGADNLNTLKTHQQNNAIVMIQLKPWNVSYTLSNLARE